MNLGIFVYIFVLFIEIRFKCAYCWFQEQMKRWLNTTHLTWPGHSTALAPPTLGSAMGYHGMPKDAMGWHKMPWSSGYYWDVQVSLKLTKWYSSKRPQFFDFEMANDASKVIGRQSYTYLWKTWGCIFHPLQDCLCGVGIICKQAFWIYLHKEVWNTPAWPRDQQGRRWMKTIIKSTAK